MSEYRLGDKLPGALISEDEWLDLKKTAESFEEKVSPEFRTALFDMTEKLSQKYCVGKDKNKCVLCGSEQSDKTGLCQTCKRAIYYRGVLRQCGKVRKIKNSDLICNICGKKKAQTLGMCRACYHYRTKYGIKDTEELKRFVAIKNKEKAPQEKEISGGYLDSVR